MTLSPEEVAFFGAMMFVAGANRTAGKEVEELAMMNKEQFREALEIAQREYPQFKQRMRDRRSRRPVS